MDVAEHGTVRARRMPKHPHDSRRTPMGPQVKAEKLDSEANSFARDESADLELIIADQGMSSLQPFSATFPDSTEGEARWHTEVLRNQDNSANVPCYMREHKEIYACRSRRFTVSECETKTCDLVAQGRARLVVSLQDTSRFTVRKRDRVCVGDLISY